MGETVGAFTGCPVRAQAELGFVALFTSSLFANRTVTRAVLLETRNKSPGNVFETSVEENHLRAELCSIFTAASWSSTEVRTGAAALPGSGFGFLAAERSEPSSPARHPRLWIARNKTQMTTWHKRDWQQFYELARRPWQRHRPPRPIYPTGLNRVLPAQGFSLSELDDAGVDLDLAERLGLPVDAGRIGAYGPNVTVLRDFVRSSRQPL
jgi:ribosomal protein L13E